MHCGAIESTLPNVGHLSQNMTIHKHEFQYTFVFWWWEWLLGERMGELSKTTTDVFDEVKELGENQRELRELALCKLDGSMPDAVKALPSGQKRLWCEKTRIMAIACNREEKEKQRRQEGMEALAHKTDEELRAITAAANAMTGAHFRAADCLAAAKQDAKQAGARLKAAEKKVEAATKKVEAATKKFDAAEGKIRTARGGTATNKAREARDARQLELDAAQGNEQIAQDELKALREIRNGPEVAYTYMEAFTCRDHMNTLSLIVIDCH
jgi:hypothetical protein